MKRQQQAHLPLKILVSCPLPSPEAAGVAAAAAAVMQFPDHPGQLLLLLYSLTPIHIHSILLSGSVSMINNIHVVLEVEVAAAKVFPPDQCKTRA